MHHKRTCSVQARHHASGIEYRHRSGLAEVRECGCDPTEAAGINFASNQLKQPQERTFHAKTGHTHCVVRDLSTGLARLCPYSKVCFVSICRNFAFLWRRKFGIKGYGCGKSVFPSSADLATDIFILLAVIDKGNQCRTYVATPVLPQKDSRSVSESFIAISGSTSMGTIIANPVDIHMIPGPRRCGKAMCTQSRRIRTR